MKNSRRGFLATLLALLPFAGSAQARSRGTSTIRIFNASIGDTFGIVAASITNPPNPNQPAKFINSATFADFTGTPGSITAVSVVDPNTGLWVQAAVTVFPPRGQIKQFNFNMVTADNVNYTLVFPSAGSAT